MKVSKFSDRPRFYALVDGDPDGIAIMSTFKYGSKAQAHQNSKLNTPNLRWLGLRMSDIVANTDSEGDAALVLMSDKDRKKVVAMLKSNPVFAEKGPEGAWRTGLQHMLMLNIKAETESLYEGEGGLEAWLEAKMCD